MRLGAVGTINRGALYMSATTTRDPFAGRDQDKHSSLNAFRPVASRAGSGTGSGQTVAPFPPSAGVPGGGAGVRRSAARSGSDGGVHPEGRKGLPPRSVRQPAAGRASPKKVSENSPVGQRPRRAFSPRLIGIGAALIIALIALIAIVAWQANRGVPAVNPDFQGGFAVPVGGAIPQFSSSFVQGSVAPYGTVFSNFDLYGRISVIIVWSSWDPLSVEWLDQLQLMRLTEFYEMPVNWVGVNYHDKLAEAQQVVEQTRTMDWPHLWLPQEPDADSASLLQLGISWVPAIYVFDPQGHLRYMGWSPAEMGEILERLRL